MKKLVPLFALLICTSSYADQHTDEIASHVESKVNKALVEVNNTASAFLDTRIKEGAGYFDHELTKLVSTLNKQLKAARDVLEENKTEYSRSFKQERDYWVSELIRCQSDADCILQTSPYVTLNKERTDLLKASFTKLEKSINTTETVIAQRLALYIGHYAIMRTIDNLAQNKVLTDASLNDYVSSTFTVPADAKNVNHNNFSIDIYREQYQGTPPTVSAQPATIKYNNPKTKENLEIEFYFKTMVKTLDEVVNLATAKRSRMAYYYQSTIHNNHLFHGIGSKDINNLILNGKPLNVSIEKKATSTDVVINYGLIYVDHIQMRRIDI